MTGEVSFVPLSHSSKEAAARYGTSSVACGDTFPSRGRTGWNSFRFCVRRNGLRAKSLPLRGGWHPASPASRMTGEVSFVPFLHPSKETAIRYDTSSVACGATFPSRGRTGWTSSRFCARRSGLRVKSLPSRGGILRPARGGILCGVQASWGNRRSTASRAAACSARFLLVPVPCPTSLPLSRTRTEKVLSWSGPVSPVSS